MTRESRVRTIKEIEKLRKSKVIAYFVGDRPNLPPAAIADDAIRVIYNHLEKMEKTKNLDLFIYTRGGNMMASFRIATLMREYCDHFGAIVPYRAHSGGTQICLGANEIVMSKLGELSPVDPSTANAFNPADRTGRPIPISVEDVRSYLKLAQEKGELSSEEAKLEIFKTLTSVQGTQTHPLALGNVNRVYDEVRLLIDQLLSSHMDATVDAEKIKEIKKQLTEVYTHSYAITRTDAIKMGLKVTKASPQLEQLMMGLYDDFAKEAKTNDPFFVEDELEDNEEQTELHEKLAFIETSNTASAYQADIEIIRPKNSQPEQVPLNLIPNIAPQVGISVSSQLPPKPNTKATIRYKRAKWVDVE